MASACGRRALLALVVLVTLVGCAVVVEARKAPGGHKVVKKIKDRNHASRKLKPHRATKSGRTGQVLDRGPAIPAPVGRRLQQTSGNTAVVPGMTVCPSALDAANYIVGAHATQLAVSNAMFSAGSCDVTAYTANAGTGGLMWGMVQTWPADHAMAPMFNGTGALLLGSGDVAEAQRVVNDADGFTADNNLAGDPDLDLLIPGYTTYDAVVLEFDVTPAKSGELVFTYVFASEEYNEWVDSPFNDVFGFWVSGPGITAPDGSNRLDIGFLPDLVTPVSINNINNGKYSQYYDDNDLDPRPTVYPPPSPFNTSYDGFTNLMNTRPVQVQAGQRYHMKLAIADAGDHILDSVVWIAGGSLLVNNPPVVHDDGPYVLSCPSSVTMHASATDDDQDPVHFTWSLTNLADPTIHIAKTTAAPTLTLPDDGIPAGTYSVVLTGYDTHGSRASSNTNLTVVACPVPAGNRPPKAVLTGPYTLPICNGVGSITMDASGSSDPDAGDSIKGYVWEVSSSTSDFELKLSGPTVAVTGRMGLYPGNVYDVEVFVRDSYGASSVAETTLTVIPGPGCSATGTGGSSGGGGTGVFTEAKLVNAPYALANCAASATLDGSASTSFDGLPLQYQWDFWNAATSEVFSIPPSGTATAAVAMATYAWLQPGITFDLTLSVIDSTGAMASDITTFAMPATCNNPPTASASASAYQIPCNGQAALTSTSTDPDAGDVLTHSWVVYAANTTTNPVANSSQAAWTIAYNTLLTPGAAYDAYLTVTDLAGASSTTPKISVSALVCNKPPVAKLSGAPYTLACGGTTQLDGTSSSDPDGNDDIAGYTFKVLDAANTLVATKTSTSGKASLGQVADGLKTNTVYTLKLEVADKAGATNTTNTTLTVGNCAPTAAIKLLPSASVACSGTVTLDGTASADSDGTIASYAWKLVSGTSSVTKTGPKANVSQTTDKLTTGATYNVTLTTTDDKGKAASAVATLTVAAGCVANSPPVCTNAKANVTRISTLNHALVPVTVTGVTDPDAGDKVTIAVTGVTQDEGTKATSDTTTWACPDAVISGATAKLAAESLATPGNGRVYTLSYTATDTKGATCSGTVTVCAKTGTSGSCTKDATSYNSTACA